LLALGPIWWLAQPSDENRAKAAMAISFLILSVRLRSESDSAPDRPSTQVQNVTPRRHKKAPRKGLVVRTTLSGGLSI
jgi:hypothetical protein